MAFAFDKHRATEIFSRSAFRDCVNNIVRDLDNDVIKPEAFHAIHTITQQLMDNMISSASLTANNNFNLLMSFLMLAGPYLDGQEQLREHFRTRLQRFTTTRAVIQNLIVARYPGVRSAA
jgi:hypothetical protein